MTADTHDPKGLIREAYQIDGITAPECRSIFLDWALSLPPGGDTGIAITALLVRYGAGQDAHPMTATLRAGLAPAAGPQRRGGRAGRVAE